MSEPLLEIRGLTRTFGGGRSWFGPGTPGVHAVQGVDLEVAQGETLGIVSESGCGKSSLARLLVGLDTPSAGQIRFAGQDLQTLRANDRHALTRRLQYVFQDPLSSLNPSKRIRDILAAPLKHLCGLQGKVFENRPAAIAYDH